MDASHRIDISRLLGCAKTDFGPGLRATLAKEHPAVFLFRPAPNQADILLTAQRARAALSSKTSVSDQSRLTVWDTCWGEYAQDQKNGGPPKFLTHAPTPARYFGQYIEPSRPDLIFHAVQRAILAHLVDTYGVPGLSLPLIEFGCGGGHNLQFLSETFPELSCRGSDWSINAVRCVQTLGFSARQFDMKTRPLVMPGDLNGNIVLTSGALEQLGGEFGNFLDYLTYARPGICIHIEPLYELYDQSYLLDAEASRYHKARGYLQNFVPAIQDLARLHQAQILDVHRTHFGSLYNEGFSWIVWRPM